MDWVIFRGLGLWQSLFMFWAIIEIKFWVKIQYLLESTASRGTEDKTCNWIYSVEVWSAMLTMIDRWFIQSSADKYRRAC